LEPFLSRASDSLGNLKDLNLGPVLVTGANGFVGARLCIDLSARSVEVVGLESGSGPSWRLDGKNIRKLQVNLLDHEKLAALVRDLQPSVIVNCAAYGAYSSQTKTDHIYGVNFNAVRHLLEIAEQLPDLRAFIQMGSSSEYGWNCAGPAENAQTIPDSHYAVSKVSASSIVQYAGKNREIPAWGIRLYSVYGPLEDFSRLMPKMLLAAREKSLPPLVNAKTSRDFVYVDDVCEAVVRVIERAHLLERGEIFNIGTGTKTSMSDLVELTRRLFKIDQEPAWGSMAARRWDHSDWYSNPKKAETYLGWQAKITLEQGLRKTMDWIINNPSLLDTWQRFSVVNLPGDKNK
jgi:nucleoside-diphosphate-sugar epimerase